MLHGCRGIYNQASECPAWGQDFNCIEGERPEDRNPELIEQEYRKIFRPHECDLPKWDPYGFEKCGPRLYFLTHKYRTNMPVLCLFILLYISCADVLLCTRELEAM